MKLSEIKFKREDSHNYMMEMINDYLDFFQKNGYQFHPSVKISSRMDPTVHFIGSHISVLKPYFLNETLPFPGYVMTQPCVRTRNLKKYNDDNFYPNWGSMFHSLGTVAVPQELKNVTELTYLFMQNIWGINQKDIKVRINSIDGDLMSLSNDMFNLSMLEIDANPLKYYRHKLGVDGVWGRNFNFALRDGVTDNFADIGNVIILENKDKQLGVEIALGTSTIMKLTKGLSHILDCHPLIGFENLTNQAIRIQIEDAIITSMALYNDGIEPSNAHITNRLMKKYMDVIKIILPKTGVKKAEFEKILSNYEEKEFNRKDGFFTQKIMQYLSREKDNVQKISHHQANIFQQGKSNVRE